jgi:PAS domain S-box-containing protein
MKPTNGELIRTIETVQSENQELKNQLTEAQEALRAICSGQVDALVIHGEFGEQIYTLQGEDTPYRAMIESIHEGAASLNASGIVLYCNQRLADQLGMPLETVLGSSFYDCLQSLDHESFTELIQKGLSHFSRAEFSISCRNGSSLPVLITASAANIAGQPGVCLVVTDLTEQKRAFLRERELQIRLMDQREEERIRIARNLHDGPLQDLIALSYTLHAAIHAVSESPQRPALQEVHDNILKLAGDLRNVCNELRPPDIVRFGLNKAIQHQTKEIQAKHPQLAISLDLNYDSHVLSKEISTTIFRIFQEGMNNILRHAQATKVQIRLYPQQNQIVFEIQDDGIGFRLTEDWVELARQGHLGLVGMRERVEAVGGKMTVSTDTGQGTTIEVKIPIGGGTDFTAGPNSSFNAAMDVQSAD